MKRIINKMSLMQQGPNGKSWRKPRGSASEKPIS
jgi:hypothetical protein